ncbi:MAG: T9SS type A sorting domain-containing protein [Crocinitomicaceae bacterium]|nr:T9SS type A sorting domain-containing protein [Crocinitomicaceae bacterium]
MSCWKLLFFFLSLPILMIAQFGCTDPLAENFDPTAQFNDGSCLYPPTSISANLLSDLPQEVRETSGVLVDENGIWTHNDSGHTPALFLLHPTQFTLVRSLVVKNAPNIDWEELASNDTHVFIGDFGNNNGNRQDLRILRFEKHLLNDASIDSIEVDFIAFTYPDQTDFTSSNNHSFDCEAFVFHNDSLHLFTKHWGNDYTKHYVLPNEIGNHTAILRDSIWVGGQITASAIQGDSLIALIGYAPPFFEPFMFLLWDFQNGLPFTGNKRRIEMGTLSDMGQQEAIAFTGDFKGYITSEELTQINRPARVYAFDIGHLFSLSDLLELFEGDWVRIFPNPTTDFLQIEVAKGLKDNWQVHIHSSNGQLVDKCEPINPFTKIAVHHLPVGNYHITLLNAQKEIVATKKIVKQ